MIKSIRQWYVNRWIRKALSKRTTRAFVSMDNCSRILVLYEVKSTEEYGLFNSFINDLKMRGKEVKPVAYFPGTDSCSVQEGTISFTHLDLNRWQLPSDEIMKEVQDFHEELLIDLTLAPVNPLNYIAAHSKALMKVGKKIESKAWLDLQIGVSEEDGVKYLTELIIHYLGCIRGADNNVKEKA